MADTQLRQDDLGRQMAVPESPQRIVSLCPSLSETLAALAPQRWVGRTRYCIHPASLVEQIAVVGGTKNPDLAAILALQPDLVLAEKEENRQQDVLALAQRVPVFVFDVVDLPSAARMLRTLGALVRAEALAAQWARQIDAAWAAIPQASRPERVLYLIWRKPWMAVGPGTYIDAVLTQRGWSNVLHGAVDRYPVLQAEQITALDPDLILLSSEPYPFRARHVSAVQALAPQAAVRLVDGELYSWYGVRMLRAAHIWQQDASA